MRNKRSSRRPRRTRDIISHPPQVQTTPTLSHTFRYVSGSSVGVNITKADLLNLLLMGGSIANTAYSLLDGVRLKRVRVWDTSSSVGGVVSISLTWSSASSFPETISDSSIGTAEPLYISTVPPKGSLAADWITNIGGVITDTGPVFSLLTTASAIVDVEVELALQNNYLGGSNAGQATTSATTAGIVYAGYLDGLFAGSTLVPVGFPPMH